MWMDKVRRGEQHPNATSTQAEADAIRARYEAGGVTMKQLAEETGKTESAIYRIVHKQSYNRE